MEMVKDIIIETKVKRVQVKHISVVRVEVRDEVMEFLTVKPGLR